MLWGDFLGHSRALGHIVSAVLGACVLCELCVPASACLCVLLLPSWQAVGRKLRSLCCQLQDEERRRQQQLEEMRQREAEERARQEEQQRLRQEEERGRRDAEAKVRVL